MVSFDSLEYCEAEGSWCERHKEEEGNQVGGWVDNIWLFRCGHLTRLKLLLTGRFHQGPTCSVSTLKRGENITYIIILFVSEKHNPT